MRAPRASEVAPTHRGYLHTLSIAEKPAPLSLLGLATLAAMVEEPQPGEERRHPDVTPPGHWRPVHWFDRVFYAALPRLSFFSDGWGDDAILDSVTMAELPTFPPAEIDVALKPERGWLGTRFLDGTFESPEHRLPPPVRRARFRLLLPQQAEPTAVLLAAEAACGHPWLGHDPERACSTMSSRSSPWKGFGT